MFQCSNEHNASKTMFFDRTRLKIFLFFNEEHQCWTKLNMASLHKDLTFRKCILDCSGDEAKS